MDSLLIVTVLALAVAALALFYAFRITGQLRTAEMRCATAEEQAKQAELLRMTLTSVTTERDEAIRKNVELQTDARNFDARMQELLASKEVLTAQFHEIGAKLLGEAQRQFLERADARFTQAGENHEAKLKALLQPVESTLKRYEEGLQRVEKEREGSYRELNKTVELLRLSQDKVRDETARLVNALRSSPKARGRWGEQQLRNVLEMAGLSEYADFQSEVSVNTEDGRLRPDVIVRLPGGRQLIIDAKCSLNAYLDASEQVDDTERARLLALHATSVRNHANQLSQKSYWSQFESSVDLVVMFIPGEHFLSAALEQDHDLWQWAADRKILLATPTNLIVIARSAAELWRQQKLAEQAAEIAALGKELHARLATMGGHIVGLGRNLRLATDSYNDFVSSLERKVLTQARRFESLEVSGGNKEIPDLPIVEVTPSSLTKLVTGPSEEAA